MCVMSHSLLRRLDEEEYGGHQLLLMEGLMPAIGVFLVRNSPEAPEAMACNRVRSGSRMRCWAHSVSRCLVLEVHHRAYRSILCC